MNGNRFGTFALGLQKSIAMDLQYGRQNSDSSSGSLGSPRNQTHQILDSNLYVIFNIKVKTLFGEQVFLTGSCGTLGEWNIERAIKMRTDEQSFPIWTAMVILDNNMINTPLEYKYVIRDTEGQTAQWEAFQENRRLVPSGLWMLVDDGLFGTARDGVKQQVISSQNFEMLSQDTGIKFDIQELQLLKQTVKDKDFEIMQVNELIRKRDVIISKLEKQLSIYEGSEIKSLSIQELKTLSTKCRQISETAQDLALRRLEEQTDQFTSFMECVACMENKIDTVLIPCGHLVVCSECSTKIQSKCPICTMRIQSMHKIYMK